MPRKSAKGTTSRTTKATRREKAGLQYVSGWLPADEAAAVRKQIAANAGEAATIAGTRTPRAPRKTPARPAAPTAADRAARMTFGERLAAGLV